MFKDGKPQPINTYSGRDEMSAIKIKVQYDICKDPENNTEARIRNKLRHLECEMKALKEALEKRKDESILLRSMLILPEKC